MLTCRELNERATDYLDDRMSLRQRLGFKLHLLMCRKCGTYVDQLARTVALLRAGKHPKGELSLDQSLIDAFRAATPQTGKDNAR